jgi:hypothetical protein
MSATTELSKLITLDYNELFSLLHAPKSPKLEQVENNQTCLNMSRRKRE